MTKKQRKARARRKAYVRAANICKRNRPRTKSFLELLLGPANMAVGGYEAKGRRFV